MIGVPNACVTAAFAFCLKLDAGVDNQGCGYAFTSRFGSHNDLHQFGLVVLQGPKIPLAVTLAFPVTANTKDIFLFDVGIDSRPVSGIASLISEIRRCCSAKALAIYFFDTGSVRQG